VIKGFGKGFIKETELLAENKNGNNAENVNRSSFSLPSDGEIKL